MRTLALVVGFLRETGERWWREWSRPVLPPEYVDALLAAGVEVSLSKADLPVVQRYLDATYPTHRHHVCARGDQVWIRRARSDA